MLKRLSFTNFINHKNFGWKKPHFSSVFFYVFFLLCSLKAFANVTEVKIENESFFKVSLPEKEISGTVTDSLTGNPLIGVTISVKGKNIGTITDSQGKFSLTVQDNAILEISFLGYSAKEISVMGKNSFTLTLSPTSTSLNQLVVVGYGTQERKTVTGAISSIQSETVQALPVANVEQAMQGRIPGLTVTNNGSPGTAPIVNIRGISSISFASNPLYVIDGMPTGDLSIIDTRDIKSVDVLKDASAAAIYGSRASSGVVLITTKKGSRDGKLHIDLNTYAGVQKVTKRLDLLNPAQFDEYAISYRGSKVPRRLDPWVNRPIYEGASKTYGNNVTDWQDEYFRQGFMTQTNIGMSGGNEVSRFYTSAGYFKQDGTSPGVSYDRYNFRLNSENEISNTFKFGENLYAAFANQAYDNNETGSRTNLLNVIRNMPYMPVHDPTTSDGFRGVDPTIDGGDPTNPIEDALVINPGNRQTAEILGTAYLEVKFTDWLKFRSTFGIDYSNLLDHRYTPIYNDGGSTASSSTVQASIVNDRTISTTKLNTQQLTFDKRFGEHHFNIIAVYEFQKQKVRNENMDGNQPTNDIKTLNNALNTSSETLFGQNALVSYLGRINYDFNSKYLVSLAIRRDGLSVWAPGKKWASFPAGSVGWRIDKEDFMQSQNLFSEIKLRGGYGITGLNGAVLGNTPWLVNVEANSAYYPFDNNLKGGPASSIQSLGNTNLEWEKTRQLNIGLDVGVFNNALTLTAEYYQRITDNLILGVPLPPSMGFLSSTVNENVGSMKNDGFELQIGYDNRMNEFHWNVLANIGINTNKALELAEGVSNIETGSDQDFTEGFNVTNTTKGHPIQSFYGWQLEGIFQNQEEVDKHAFQTEGTAPGDLMFKDLNNDGKIDEQDRTFLGSFLPKFTYSLNLGGDYKGFGLKLFFQGVQGNKIYNATRTATEGMIRFFNAGTQVLNAWTPSHTNTDIPRAASSDPNQNARPSTRFIEDGSYLRLKNVMLSYDVPAHSLENLTKGIVNDFRIYFSAQNLITITNYTGYDPEVGNRTPSSSLTNGIDYAVYPQPKALQFGIIANF